MCQETHDPFSLLCTTWPRLPGRNNQLTHLIRRIQHPTLACHLTRGTTITRRDIQRRILIKEIPRAQQQRHRLRRHDGEILRSWEVRDTEGVPEDDVGVVDRGLAIGDPFWDTPRRLARGLGHVPAGGVELVVGIWEVLGLGSEIGEARRGGCTFCYVYSMASKAGSFPD
jgi:hypothetical protein